MDLKKKMQLKQADIADIDNVLKLHYRYHIDFISEEDKKEGFVTTPFTKEQLRELIEEEKGLFIAVLGGDVVAYVMAASWQFWSRWPMFAFMLENLPNLKYLGQKLNIHNSYQYGPICIDKSVRGSGVLEKIFGYSQKEMSKKYPILVTFINKINTRSYQAHTKKLGLEVIAEFDYNNNHYYELAFDTARELNSIPKE